MDGDNVRMRGDGSSKKKKKNADYSDLKKVSIILSAKWESTATSKKKKVMRKKVQICLQNEVELKVRVAEN